MDKGNSIKNFKETMVLVGISASIIGFLLLLQHFGLFDPHQASDILDY